MQLGAWAYTDQRTQAEGYRNLAGKPQRSTRLLLRHQLLWGLGFARLHWRGARRWVAQLTRCAPWEAGGAWGACPATAPTENVPLEACPRWGNCRWREQKGKSRIYQAASKYPPRQEESFPCTCLRRSISGRIYWSSALQLETPGKSFTWMRRRNSEVTISTRRPSGFILGLELHVLAVGFPSLPSGCEDLAGAWSRSRLS